MSRPSSASIAPAAARHPIEVSEEAGVRYLHFGTEWVQGAMRVARPWALELDYTREMMAALLLRPTEDWPRHALVIGLGAASLTKFLYRHRPATRITVVEINPEVVAVARSAFRLPDDDARLTVRVGDGLAWVRDSRSRYDLILVDGFDHRARAGALATGAFYRDCHQRLSKHGLLVANLFGRSRNYKSTLEQLRRAFDERVIAFASGDHGNVVAIAARGEPVSLDADALRVGAETLWRDTGLKLRPALPRLQQASPGCGGGVFI